MTIQKCSVVRFRSGREAIDPRTGMLQTSFLAGDTLEIFLDGPNVVLQAPNGVSVSALSNAHGVILLPEPAPVAVQAAKPAKPKAKVEK